MQLLSWRSLPSSEASFRRDLGRGQPYPGVEQRQPCRSPQRVALSCLQCIKQRTGLALRFLGLLEMPAFVLRGPASRNPRQDNHSGHVGLWCVAATYNAPRRRAVLRHCLAVRHASLGCMSRMSRMSVVRKPHAPGARQRWLFGRDCIFHAANAVQARQHSASLALHGSLLNREPPQQWADGAVPDVYNIICACGVH